MAAVLIGAAAGAGVTILADILIANLKQAVGCKRECKKLEKTIETIKPYLRQVEIQLAKKRNDAQQNCEIMAKWLADMKEQMEAANREIHEYLSGPEVLAPLNLIGNRRIGKRIEEVNNEIDLLFGKALTMAVFAFNLANTPQAANTQALVADTAQQQNANALHHGYCNTPNIVQQQNANALHHGYSSTPNILQTPDFQSEHAFHPGHSMPAVRTSHYPPMADQSMSQHSSPVTAHRTPNSWAFSNQSQAAASWTPPGTPHLYHSRSEKPIRSTMYPAQWNAPATSHLHHSRSEDPIRNTMSPDQWNAPGTSYLHHSRSEEPIRSTISPDQWNAPATSHLHHSRSEPEVVRSAWSPDQWPAAANHDHHRRQSIDHPGFLRGASSAQETLRQRELDIHRIKDAEEKTRSDQRRQSIANPQQHVPTSYQPSAPPRYQAPSAQPRHNDPSAAPSAPSAPYSLLYSHCTE